MRSIDLNCDVGEGIGLEAEILPLVSSANIACGAHAGDSGTMKSVRAIARAHGVAVGAHPGFADRENFGRREMELSEADLRVLLLNQLEALAEFGRFDYVKPHGALYNMAANDADMARVVASTVKEFDANLWLMGLAGSAGLKIAAETGLKTVAEAFADRRYDDQGGLLSRALPNAVIGSADEAIEQVLNLVQRGQVKSAQGLMVPMAAESICLHGDNPGALGLARRLREALTAAESAVQPFVPRT